MNKLFKLVGAMALTLTVLAGTSAPAIGFDVVTIETWVGDTNAANKAVMVIDFGPQSFAFGYAWDGAATGFDMINAVAIATDLDIVDDTEYGGHLVNSISYHGYSFNYDSYNWSDTEWWEYWTATDGTDWVSSWEGCGDRVLTNGAWDGWTRSPVYPAVGTAPDVPGVPEPASFLALAAGFGMIVMRRKR